MGLFLVKIVFAYIAAKLGSRPVVFQTSQERCKSLGISFQPVKAKALKRQASILFSMKPAFCSKSLKMRSARLHPGCCNIILAHNRINPFLSGWLLSNKLFVYAKIAARFALLKLGMGNGRFGIIFFTIGFNGFMNDALPFKSFFSAEQTFPCKRRIAACPVRLERYCTAS